MTPANLILCFVIAQIKDTTITARRPSELPLVLIVATIGFNSHMLANFRALSLDICEVDSSILKMSNPAIMSPTANKTFPKENDQLYQAVGSSSHASRGVYLYVSRSYGDCPLNTYRDASVKTK